MVSNIQNAIQPTGTEGLDYELVSTSAWVRVGTLAIWIRDIDAGVKIEVYPDGNEMDQPLNEIMTYYVEANSDG